MQSPIGSNRRTGVSRYAALHFPRSMRRRPPRGAVITMIERSASRANTRAMSSSRCARNRSGRVLYPVQRSQNIARCRSSAARVDYLYMKGPSTECPASDCWLARCPHRYPGCARPLIAYVRTRKDQRWHSRRQEDRHACRTVIAASVTSKESDIPSTQLHRRARAVQLGLID